MRKLDVVRLYLPLLTWGTMAACAWLRPQRRHEQIKSHLEGNVASEGCPHGRRGEVWARIMDTNIGERRQICWNKSARFQRKKNNFNSTSILRERLNWSLTRFFVLNQRQQKQGSASGQRFIIHQDASVLWDWQCLHTRHAITSCFSLSSRREQSTDWPMDIMKTSGKESWSLNMHSKPEMCLLWISQIARALKL